MASDLPLSPACGGPPPQTPPPMASHQRLASPPAALTGSAPATFSGSVMAAKPSDITAEEGALIISGMKFSSPPPKPLQIVGLSWLHKVDLKSVGCGLLDLPYVGGRKVVEFDVSRTSGEPGSEPDLGVGSVDYCPELEWELPEFGEPVLQEIAPSTTEIEQPPVTSHFPRAPRQKRVKKTAGKKNTLPSQNVKLLDPPSFWESSTVSAKPSSLLAVKPLPKPLPNLPSAKPTRKSSRLAFKSTRRTQKQDLHPIAVHDTTSESLSSSDEPITPPVPTQSESMESSPIRPLPSKSTPKSSTTNAPKRKRAPKPVSAPSHEEAEVSNPKRARKVVAPSPKLKRFLQRNIVRGKIVNSDYFQEQGLNLFLEKLSIQGWLDIFTDSRLTCSAPDLAEFYATVSISHGVVTARVGGVRIIFDAKKLGDILGVPAEGCAEYVREERALLSQDQYLQLARKLSQQPSLSRPTSVKKGDMTPLHQLMFWFIIKNVIPRGQGRNSADGMDQHFIDMLDCGVPINLPAIMIRHIHRIATNTRDHMLGYGFLLTRVFAHFGVALQKPVGVQTVDIIGSTTLLGCDFVLRPDQEVQTPPQPVPATSSSTTPGSMAEEVARQKTEIAEIKTALEEERAVNAKRHEDILSLFSSLLTKMNPPAP